MLMRGDTITELGPLVAMGNYRIANMMEARQQNSTVRNRVGTIISVSIKDGCQ